MPQGKIDSSRLLDEVRNGKRKAYAWGVGYFFDACSFLHGIPLHAGVHTSNELIGTHQHGLRIVAPDELLKLDPETSLVIGYSSQFRDQITQFCRKAPQLPVIFYDDPALLNRKRIQEIISSLRLAAESGVLKAADLRLLNQATGGAAPAPASGADQGFEFWAVFKRDVCNALTRQVHFIFQENLQGDIAEFGTYSGTSASFLASAMADAPMQPRALGGSSVQPQRILHLFDSFQGLPEITHDLDKRAGWKAGQFTDKTEAQLKSMVGQYLHSDAVKTYPGWFKDTMKLLPNGQKFALVHVDCDIYESTIDVLDYLFSHEHIGEGCALFFDDWNCGAANPDLGERRAWREMVEKHSIRYTDCGNYSAFGNKFLIHVKKHS